jgi:CDP-diacylglycerol--serine O-phosphatidyltransferase
MNNRVARMSLRDRLVDPRFPDRRPRRAAYALPTLFTSANVFLGFYALLEVFEAAMNLAAGVSGAALHFKFAAMAIAGAVFFDGLDGRIARMTNTTSDFGRELDSLADVITFGIAPAALAFAWGVYFVKPSDPTILYYLRHVGYFVSFLFLLCGACRLARFNIQKNPVPKNPGRSDRKYFVGLPIPAAAGAVAAIVYACDGVPLGGLPLDSWVPSVVWLALLGGLAFLMVSTWRYPSFKDLTLTRPRSPITFVGIASAIYLVTFFSRPVLLAAAAAYVLSGVAIRLGGIVRRRFKPAPPAPEHQVG